MKNVTQLAKDIFPWTTTIFANLLDSYFFFRDKDAFFF